MLLAVWCCSFFLKEHVEDLRIIALRKRFELQATKALPTPATTRQPAKKHVKTSLHLPETHLYV
jgi:hypothetical protein